ncbi:M61 family metallopeptidase [Urechidicola vernalis]|uniref:PDZ domain-containing protein n=1 Tax=Urechidicola vernalis TaxID=3075600 RepID=A0ABU2Y8S2_9FLAO|nr:PDZ domain-containing protein [Urechidicola sp. P050]MDT0554069.1 PDZ domain-containing protein [Urechidicola sp. P050]
MKRFTLALVFLFSTQLLMAQVESRYELSFENAQLHQAEINATFSNLTDENVELRMSRTSPGRYALHEFVKNVFNLKATDQNGKELALERKDPYSWNVTGHSGTVNISYTLFANHGDGTYAQIDETHAHLNAPPTFIYAPSLSTKGFEVTFNLREDLEWKVATQLKHLTGTTYSAKDLHYLMDSPMEISNHEMRSHEIDGQTIRFALHHNGTSAEFDTYFKNSIKIVQQQKAVFGELPKFDYGEYTFLGCYLPHVDGDGMEHRNSTVLTSTRSLKKAANRNIGTVSHEFFHAWNVERIRPKSLEPFNYEAANMSGELWFAEGFTNYYTGLIMHRAGLTTMPQYIKSMQGTFNYVWNSPGRKFSGPIEMSNQAVFVDAAEAVDQTYFNNTFISYYSYGQMLGLALDLTLRTEGLNLDDYMKLVWNKFGKNEIPYTNKNLEEVLVSYAGKEIGASFFNNYIFGKERPDLELLFTQMGVSVVTDTSKIEFGTRIKEQIIQSYPKIGSTAYNAGLTKGDKIIRIDSIAITAESNLNSIISNLQPNKAATIVFERHGKKNETKVKLVANNNSSLHLFEDLNKPVNESIKYNRDSWLQAK